MKRQWRRPTHNGNTSDLLVLEFEFQFDAGSTISAWGMTAYLERTNGTPWSVSGVEPRDAVSFDARLASMYRLRGRIELVRTGTQLYLEAKHVAFGFELEAFQTFEGVLLEIPNPVRLDPPVPERPAPPNQPVPYIDDPELIEDAEVGLFPAREDDGGELFPYVYMRRWPQPNPEEVAERFITYPHPLDESPSGTFVQTLSSIRRTDPGRARDRSIELAIAYIDGRTGGDVPFIRDQEAIPESLAGFPTALQVLERASEPAKGLESSLASLGTTIDELPTYLAAREPALVRVWQSNFALVVVLGYDPSLRDTLARILRLDHLLRWVVAHAGTSPSTETFTRLLEAVVELPGALFPLPPVGGPPTSIPEPDHSPIVPYAIGELRMTRHQRLGYAAGELAALECVQSGERREIVRRRKTSELSSSSTTELDEDRHTSTNKSLDTSLKAEAQGTLADTTCTTQYNKFSTSYGPSATATVDGGWTLEVKPSGEPATEDTTRFAQEVLSKAAQRVTHRVTEARRRAHLSEDEESVTSVLDNSAGSTPRCTAYFWLDELFEAYVVNYGDRLILELLIEDPAAALLQAQDDPNYVSPRLLPAPPALGIETFTDITPSNFPRIVSAYPSVALTLPPVSVQTITTTLHRGQTTTVELPEGTAAKMARVCAASINAGAQVQVLVGRASFSFTVDGPVVQQQSLDGEQGSVAVAAEISAPLSSPPASPGDAVVTVAVDAAPSDDALNAWKLATFQTIQRAYQDSLTRGGSSGEPGEESWPERRSQARHLERQVLMRAGMDLLFDRAAQLLGEGTPSTDPRGRFSSARPRYLQFLETSFEWDKMSYAVLGRNRAPNAAISTLARTSIDPGFLAFLEAEYVRILLPISLVHAPAILFFLRSGMLWDGPSGLVQSLASDVALRSELVGLIDEPARVEQVGRSWTVRVPTSIKVLRDLRLLPGTTEP